MNQTFNKRLNNPVSFDLHINPNKDSRQKKSSCIYNCKNIYKQPIIPGNRYPQQSNSIFNNYYNFPSLTKCHSTAKLTKKQNTSFPFERHPSPSSQSPQKYLNKNGNEKSPSTSQSTDERKELNRLKAEMKEKNDVIKNLQKAIDKYIQEKNSTDKEMKKIKNNMLELKIENSRIKKDYKALQFENELLQRENKKLQSKEIKLSEIMGIASQEEISMIRDQTEENNDNKNEEQSLSGICFTDKVKMVKKLENNDKNIPALNFNVIYNEKEEPHNLISLIKNVCINEQNNPQSNSCKKMDDMTGKLIKSRSSIGNKVNQ